MDGKEHRCLVYEFQGTHIGSTKFSQYADLCANKGEAKGLPSEEWMLPLLLTHFAPQSPQVRRLSWMDTLPRLYLGLAARLALGQPGEGTSPLWKGWKGL